MEYEGRHQYHPQAQAQTQSQSQDPYYYTQNPERPPPPPAPPPQQTGSGPGNGNGNGHEQGHGYPPIYKSSPSGRPSPPPTPHSAPHHMSANMPPNVGRSMSDHMGMYRHAPPRSDEASGSRRTTSPTEGGGSVHNSGGNRPPGIKRVGGKANVSSACAPCKKAHLACDIMRPCKRCVNMGKEDLCEDVPHKKRGRPKVNKGPLGAPFQRVRTHGDDISAQYRQPLPPPFPPPGSAHHPYDPLYHPQLPPPPFSPYGQPHPGQPGFRQPLPTSNSLLPPPPISSDPPGLFTVFTTIDLRIIRATQGCANMIGYPPEHLSGHSLLDWLHPADRSILDNERIRLITLPNSHGILGAATHRDLFTAIQQRSERELLSPAEGMKDQYPNQNVRLVRSDQQYNLFNVRLHLGGGLGASLFQPETHDRIYLVVSCLLVPNQQVPPLATAVTGARATSVIPTGTSISTSSYGPPTPITPMTLGIGAGPPTGGLPSFSSIAAGVDVPPPQTQQIRYPHAHSTTPYGSRPGTGPQQYTPSSSSGPGSGLGSGYYQPRGVPHQSHSHPHQQVHPQSLPPVQTQIQTTPTPTTTMYPKSPSPSPAYRQPQPQPDSRAYPPYDYPPPPPGLHQSQTPSQGYYLDEGIGYRQNTHPQNSQDEWAEWRRRPDDLDPSPSLSHEPLSGGGGGVGSDMQTPTSAIPIDYSRRPWET